MSRRVRERGLAPRASRSTRSEERRYRERTPRSLELLERTRRLIPTGHGGGMWYQLPYPGPARARQGLPDLGRRRQRVPRPPDRRLGDDPRPRERARPRRGRRAAREGRRSSAAPTGTSATGWRRCCIERMPSVERVRFLVSGTEANLLALRLARAYTGPHEAREAAGQLPRPLATSWSTAARRSAIAQTAARPAVIAGRPRGARRASRSTTPTAPRTSSSASAAEHRRRARRARAGRGRDDPGDDRSSCSGCAR